MIFIFSTIVVAGYIFSTIFSHLKENKISRILDTIFDIALFIDTILLLVSVIAWIYSEGIY